MLRRATPLLPVLLLLPFPGVGQDVLLLGEVYGTRPPAAYWEELRRDPTAYRFQREGMERLRHIQENRPLLLRDALLGRTGPLRSLGPRETPVIGTFRFPLVPGLFSDSPPSPPFTRDRIQEEYFDGPNSYDQTLTEFYTELSRGLAELRGEVHPWQRGALTRDRTTLGSSGLASSREEGVGAYIESLLVQLDSMGVDWSRYDSTGDGFVDVLLVLHPDHGAECGGGGANRIWSHRWTLRSATQGRLDPGYRTATPRPDGNGFIYINDYTVQPVLACNAQQIAEIGIIAHELGHGFGLPDLYATGGLSHRGAGNWDLMGTGAWGCRGGDPARPCHMGAWSKAMLGWLEIEDIPRDTDLGSVELAPVQEGRVLRVPSGDGSGEYLLLENRQRLGTDYALYEPGLLIWHVDPVQIGQRWALNTVNNDPGRMGVWLRQADGRNDLAGSAGNRGDRGDPFPGCIIPDSLRFHPDPPCERNRVFHVGTNPAARTHSGGAMGITLSGIELLGAEPHRVRFNLDTRFRWDTVQVTVATEAARPQSFPLEVDGAPSGASWHFVAGTLPEGLVFSASTTRIEGLTYEVGSYPLSFSTVDGSGGELLARVELEVTPPRIPLEELTAVFLGKPDPLTLELRLFLDRYGNQNTTYDLGDLRAYLQANPDVAATMARGGRP